MIGYHASHEQFSPSSLLYLVHLAEKAGFSGIMSSDHITPWSVRQGNSGCNWPWLGAAMQKSSLPFGTLAVPGGWRYHPAAVAHMIATLAEMFPKRLRWVAAASGEFMNEHVTGQDWPDKNERDLRLIDAVEIMRSLWRGETVDRENGPLKTDKAKLWSLPENPPLVYGPAISAETARWMGGWADGLITVRKPVSELRNVIDAFRKGGGEGKPIVLQLQLSWAENRDQAKMQAWDQWRSSALEDGHENIRTAEEFDKAAKDIAPENMEGVLPLVAGAKECIDMLMPYISLGFDEIYLHNAGRNQEQFIEFFAKNVLPEINSCPAP